ncbi:MAG TPA: NusG domain II-containing protein [Methylophilaceae bacterium]|nr:NusG domain II-containing protein [Methylophilaceae bacterium]
MVISLAIVVFLFKTLWHGEQATKLRIRQGNIIYATLSLDQERTLDISGPLGTSRIEIQKGQARFERSPCLNQYCVHQGWLKHAGQVALCLPNHLSLELLGSERPYDSLNY